MVGVEVGTYLGVDAAGTPAFVAGILIVSPHSIHIGAGTAQIGEVALEIIHLNDLSYLSQDALLGAAGNELALMGGNGAEGTAAKTPSVDVDAVLDHLVSRDALTFVFRMGQTGVGKVETGIGG